MRRLQFVPLLAIGASLLVSPAADATVVTVGSPLLGTYVVGEAEPGSYLATNLLLAAPGSQVRSPVSGAIVRWHLIDSAGAFALRTMRPAGGTAYTSTGESASVTPLGTGLETFPTALPIIAGEAIGLYVPAGSEPGIDGTSPGNTAADWDPALAPGATGPYTFSEHGEYAFNAEIQPAPTITTINPAGGPAPGTTVTILGTDFEAATSVRFGAAPAAFSVNSEGAITAVAPPGAGAVPISVTTIAGTVTSTQLFTYGSPVAALPEPTTCTVPKLKGKTLKASKRKIRGADCKVGTVTKKKGATAKSGKVVRQSRKPGSVLPAGTKIKVVLGGRFQAKARPSGAI